MKRRAFTLIELLCVIGIIAILIAILLPAMAGVRKQARAVQCASNMRQVVAALMMYTVPHNGAFPPNSAQVDQYWFDEACIGRYIKSQLAMPRKTIAGGVMVCPSDIEIATRSYSMNTFASGVVSTFVQDSCNATPPRGKMFKLGVSESSNIILLAEGYSGFNAPPESDSDPYGFNAFAIIGWQGDRPGQRFGVGGGIPFTAGRFGDSISQIAFFRHRNIRGPYLVTDPIGRANFAFMDGHVALLRHDEVANPVTGKSTYVAMWSTIDRNID